MNTSDLLTLQTKLTDLNKRAREIAGKVKYHGEELLKLHAGEYNQCLSWDADFVTRNLKRHQDELEKAQGGLQALKSVIAELEAKRPEVNRYTEILDGLKGNVREVARNAIEVVIASEELGCWIPHGSRKVHGLVDKKGKGANWAAFKAAVAALDDQRSKATFIVDPSKVSPTVRKTLDGLNLDSATIRVCPIEYREVVELVNGKSVTLTVAILLWPKGTKHGASRFHATNSNLQCQACGHAIRNPFNWVPVLVDSKPGLRRLGLDSTVPHSLWVGRDCAKNLFGIELVGALRLAEGQR